MSLPTPFYEDSAVTIYHGDAADILPAGAAAGWCGGKDAVMTVLTDPPWGIKGTQNTRTRTRGQKNDYTSLDDCPDYVHERVIPIISCCVEWFRTVIVTPGNVCVCMYPNPDSFGCFYQPASVGLQRFGRADAQPILYYGAFPHSTTEIPKFNCSFVLTEPPEKNGHPCPKPQMVWHKLLVLGSNQGETILDPFMGSGTTLRAAKDLGRRAIGIEISREYCEIAVERLRQEVFPLEATL